MGSVDKAAGEAFLASAWGSLGHRVAVTGGSFVALLSLFHHVPPSTAALRGAGTWFALLVVARLGGFALRHAFRLDDPKKQDSAEGPRKPDPSQRTP